MSGIKIDIKGLKELQGKFDNIGKVTAAKIQKELSEFAVNTAAEAKRNCPVNEGFLRNSISPVVKPGHVEIIVAADYAAYVEFGTRKFAAAYVATLPQDWQTYAATFKGKTEGTFDEFIARLVKWVMKKGIGETYSVNRTSRISRKDGVVKETIISKRDRVGKQSAKTTAEADAYAIAMHILRNGTAPHPFLFPAVENNKKILIDNLKNIL